MAERTSVEGFVLKRPSARSVQTPSGPRKSGMPVDVLMPAPKESRGEEKKVRVFCPLK